MAKKLPIQNVVCTNCHARVQVAPRYNVLGLLRFDCPICSRKFLYPMSPRRRKVYIGIAVVFSVMAVAVIVASGTIIFPGILPALAVIGLIQDSNARARVRAAESATPTFKP